MTGYGYYLALLGYAFLIMILYRYAVFVTAKLAAYGYYCGREAYLQDSYRRRKLQEEEAARLIEKDTH